MRMSNHTAPHAQNGIRTLLGYSPWHEEKSYEKVLTDLGGDICCFQETKITPAHIDRNMACLDRYDAFFSSFRRTAKGSGIHGTCIYTRRAVVIPSKAEEGISSTLLPPDSTSRDRIGGYPSITDTDLTLADMKDLDLEGRTTIVDCGLFVVITVYCPNAGEKEERHVFKQKFNTMLEERVRSLIRLGREVVVCGDINVTHSLESDDKMKIPERDSFKTWLRDMIHEKDGILVDITRKFHPTRKDMFTYWETKIDARATNFGCRIDFILITRGLVPWVKFSDIMPTIRGSDHCPVYVEFHEEIEVEGRGKVSLWQEMNRGRRRDADDPAPPPFAIRYRDDFSGKQKTLGSYFGMGSVRTSIAVPEASPTSTPTINPVFCSSSSSSPTVIVPASPSLAFANDDGTTPALKVASSNSSATASTTTLTVPTKRLSDRSISDSLSMMKRRSVESVPTQVVTKGIGRESGQQSLSFIRPVVKAKVKDRTKKSTAKEMRKDGLRRSPSTESSAVIEIVDSDDDIPFPIDSIASSSSSSSHGFLLEDYQVGDGSNASNSTSVTSTWSNIFSKRSVPDCDGHGEPATIYTVNKPGKNKGRSFWLCTRPVGEGYDKGQPKLHVNPLFRCNYFLWESDARKKVST